MAIIEKWEYKFVSLKERNLQLEGSFLDKLKIDATVRAQEKFLNEMGSDGWEWIPPQLLPNNKMGNYAEAGYSFFRRRLAP